MDIHKKISCILLLGLALLVHGLIVAVPLEAMEITLTWEANTDPNLAGYIIYYNEGLSGPPYQNTLDVGNVTRHTVQELNEKEQYFFSITAYNTSKLESDYSNEVRTVQIVDITSDNADGMYQVGDAIDITLSFSEPVTLTGGNIILTFDTGNKATIEPFFDQACIKTSYIIQTGDISDNLNVISLELTDGTLQTIDGLDCQLSLPLENNLKDNKDIIIEGLYLFADRINLAFDMNSYNKTTFKVVGAVGTIIWPDLPGLIIVSNTEAQFTAQEVPADLEKIDTTITIFDTGRNGLEKSVQITTWKTLKIADYPSSLKAGDEFTFTLSGGDNTNYFWAINGPLDLEDATGSNYLFQIPTLGTFAGTYSLTVLDNQGFSEQITITVPMTIIENKWNFLMGDPQKAFSVSGIDNESSVQWWMVAKDDSPIDDKTVYGRIEIQDKNSILFTPAQNVSKIIDFRWKVTTDQQSLIDDGLNTHYSGPIKIVPTTKFTLTLLNEEEVPIDGTKSSLLVTELQNRKSGYINNQGQAEFTLPDLGGTFEYSIIDESSSPLYISKTISSSAKEIMLILEYKGGEIFGIVEDTEGNPIEKAMVWVSPGIESSSSYYSNMTDANGNYTVLLDRPSPTGNFIITAGKTGHIFRSQLAQLNTAANFTGNYHIDPQTKQGLQRKTEISHLLSKGENEGTLLTIKADPGFTGSEKEIIIDPFFHSLTFSGPSWQLFLPSDEEITITMQADTSTSEQDASEGYFSSITLTYNNSAAMPTACSFSSDINSSGGEGILEANQQRVKVEIPPGGISGTGLLLIQQIPKINLNSVYTEGSPQFIYSIQISDPAYRAILPKIDHLIITLPFNTEVILPGDLENNKYSIFQAETIDELESGQGKPIEVNQIITTDYISESLGYVKFSVSSLKFFSIGRKIKQEEDYPEDSENEDYIEDLANITSTIEGETTETEEEDPLKPSSCFIMSLP